MTRRESDIHLSVREFECVRVYVCVCGQVCVRVCVHPSECVREREKAGVSEGESGQPFLVVVCSPERGRRMEGRMSKKEEEDWKSSEEISLYKVEDIKGETKGGGADNDSLASRKKNFRDLFYNFLHSS